MFDACLVLVFGESEIFSSQNRNEYKNIDDHLLVIWRGMLRIVTFFFKHK